MSISELNKTKNLHNDSANSIPISQENSYHAIDMELVKKETETPGSLSITKRKDFVRIDITENSIEHRAHTNEEVDAGILANISNLKVHVIRSADARRKSTINKFYDWLVDFRKQHQLERQIRNPKGSPQLPDLTKNQDLLQVQGYPPGPGYVHSQGYPQEEDQGKVTRLRGGFDYVSGERSTFVLLVLAITSIMLASTTTFVGIVLLTPDLRNFFNTYGLLIFFPAIICVITVNCIFAYSECGRRLPCNVICLVITVIAMSCLAAVASSKYKTSIIFQAILATTIIVAICTILACTSFDFTGYLIYVLVIALALALVTVMFFGVRILTGEKFTVVRLILLLVGTVVQSVLLIIELQMILGGRAIELNESDYALGAFYLYTSIVNLFMKMLGLIGILSEDL